MVSVYVSVYVFLVFDFYGAQNILNYNSAYDIWNLYNQRNGSSPSLPIRWCEPIACRSCREFFTPLNMEFDFVDFRDPENVKKARQTAGGRVGRTEA